MPHLASRTVGADTQWSMDIYHPLRFCPARLTVYEPGWNMDGITDIPQGYLKNRE